MISALESLKRAHEMPNSLPETLTAFAIRGGLRQGIRAMFSSHPPLDTRIAALRALP
jgi:heat shock protein HtpX